MPTKTPKQVHTKRANAKPDEKETHSAVQGVLGWLDRHIARLLIAMGAIGTGASLALALEEFHMLKHPGTELGCDLNPIINCGGNMQVWQGHVFFGMPNAFLGLMIFVAVLTIGVALLAGAQFKRWFWLALEAGLVFGLLFVHWFIFQSLYVLNELCPYCMVTWVITISGFWYVTLYELRRGFLTLPQGWERASRFAQRHHADILAAWLLIIIILIGERFWYYWSTLL